MSIFANIKKSWNNYLERLAKENERTFQNGKPNCCTMNRQRPAPDRNRQKK